MHYDKELCTQSNVGKCGMVAWTVVFYWGGSTGLCIVWRHERLQVSTSMPPLFNYEADNTFFQSSLSPEVTAFFSSVFLYAPLCLPSTSAAPADGSFLLVPVLV